MGNSLFEKKFKIVNQSILKNQSNNWISDMKSKTEKSQSPSKQRGKTQLARSVLFNLDEESLRKDPVNQVLFNTGEVEYHSDSEFCSSYGANTQKINNEEYEENTTTENHVEDNNKKSENEFFLTSARGTVIEKHLMDKIKMGGVNRSRLESVQREMDGGINEEKAEKKGCNLCVLI